MSHTPGPWDVDPLRVGAKWNIGTFDTDIALAAQLIGDDDVQSKRLDNARLIAAAPELLEACRICVDHDEARFMPGYKTALEAIAKAEGRI